MVWKCGWEVEKGWQRASDPVNELDDDWDFREEVERLVEEE